MTTATILSEKKKETAQKVDNIANTRAGADRQTQRRLKWIAIVANWGFENLLVPATVFQSSYEGIFNAVQPSD